MKPSIAILVVSIAATTLRAGVPQPERSTQPVEVFRSGTHGVVVYVTVFDAARARVAGLRQDEFEVSSDDEAVPIRHFAAHDGAVTAALLVDVSASMHFTNALMDRAVQELAKSMRPGDRIRLGAFAAKMFLGTQIATDGTLVPKQFRQLLLKLEDEDTLGPSPIWDAAWTAAGSLVDTPGPRAVILLTDGRATGNRLALGDLAEGAAAAGVAMHSVVRAMRRMPIHQSGKTAVIVQPQVALARLADYTGGTCTEAFDELPRTSLAAALDDARPGYVLGFAAPQDGRRHRLTIRVKRPGHVVRARMSYLAQNPVATGGR